MDVRKVRIGSVFIVAAMAKGGWAQNPSPPYATIPDGWDVSYFNLPSQAGIKGPKGELISFSAYMASGQVARVQREMDTRSLGFRMILDDRLMELALTPGGLLAVSYPQPRNAESQSGVFDYWMQTGTVRQTVKGFMIMLSYFDVRKEKQSAAEELRAMASPHSEFPFRGLGAGWPLPYNANDKSFSTSKDLRESEQVTVQLADGEFPKETKWSEESPLLGGKLSVVEAKDSRIWSRYTDREGKVATFTVQNGGKGAVLLAMAASLTYMEMGESSAY